MNVMFGRAERHDFEHISLQTFLQMWNLKWKSHSSAFLYDPLQAADGELDKEFSFCYLDKCFCLSNTIFNNFKSRFSCKTLKIHFL